MHISLDQAIGRQPRLNRVGQSLLNIASGASAAYSLRSLTGDEPKAVRIRRDGDNEERDFTTAEIGNEAADWTNGKQETTLPADVATSAAAYSLRKVKSDYTGPAVRIRRESDDVEVNVSFDTNDEVSTSSPIENTTEQGGESGSTTATTLGEFISGTNAAVHTWYDQSGNSKNATEEVAANQPLIAESGVLHTDGGKPALKFNGTSHRLDLSAKATIANTSIFSAFRSNSDPQDSVLFHLAVDSSNVVSIGFGDLAGRSELGSRLRVSGQSDVHVGDNAFTSTSQSLVSYIASSTAAKMFVDSTEKTDTVESRNSGANNRIGARGNDQRFFNGDISEVILFDSDQTNNRFKIESNINNYYTIYTAAQNGFVHTWYDQSGNGFNAVADADENEPKIVSSGSLPADGIEFESGANLELSGSGLDIFKNAPNGHIFSVIKPGEQGTSNNRYFEALVADGSGARFLFGDGQDVNATFRIGGRSLDSDSFGDEESPTSHNGALSLMTGFLDYHNAKGFLFLNGTQVATNTIPNITGSNTSNTSSNKVAIGAATASLTSDFFAKEFIIYNTDQTSNRTALENNMINHYGIS